MITIDGTEYEVEAGNNLLEAALSLGLDLPYFCWHPAMGSVGACRQCAVVQYQNAEDQRGRIVGRAHRHHRSTSAALVRTPGAAGSRR